MRLISVNTYWPGVYCEEMYDPYSKRRDEGKWVKGCRVKKTPPKTKRGFFNPKPLKNVPKVKRFLFKYSFISYAFFLMIG
jgi:hypothetical protein